MLNEVYHFMTKKEFSKILVVYHVWLEATTRYRSFLQGEWYSVLSAAYVGSEQCKPAFSTGPGDFNYAVANVPFQLAYLAGGREAAEQIAFDLKGRALRQHAIRMEGTAITDRLRKWDFIKLVEEVEMSASARPQRSHHIHRAYYAG